MDLLYVIEIIIFALILVPTLIAMVTGAPWVPTPMVRVKTMLALAKLKPGDRVYDLGCGDGRMVQEASKQYGADAVGIELSPLIFLMAKIRNFVTGSKAKILMRDFRRIHYGNAKAVVFYLLPEILKVMRPKFEEELAPGTLIISYAFQVEGWTPVHIEAKDRQRNLSPIYVYEMPISTKAKGIPANQ